MSGSLTSSSCSRLASESLLEDIRAVTREAVTAPGPWSVAFCGTQRFLIEGMIGHGSFGRVYRAHDQKQGCRVALKVLYRNQPGALRCLKREFREIRGLVHPNLIELYELHHAPPHWFYTMRLIEGGTFLDHVRQDAPGPLPFHEGRLRATLPQLCAGVHALHRARKLHRDIKPTNVLVDARGRVVLVDFGLITALVPACDQSGGPVGTPAYMSPEQAELRELTAKSDFYSVGVLLYEALTGKLPFSGSPRQILEAKCSTEPVPPRDLVPDIPEDLDRLCQGLLARDPARRFGMGEILSVLPLSSRSLRLERDPSCGGDEIFIGREHHLARLRDLFRASAGRQPVVICLHGSPGMGKTTLASRFVAALRSAGEEVLVLQGRCDLQEHVPHNALDGIVDQLASHLMKLPPHQLQALLPPPGQLLALADMFEVLHELIGPTRSAVPAPVSLWEKRRLAAEALRQLLHRLSSRRPLLLLIDDLQRGDGDSADLIAQILTHPEPPPLVLLLCYRSEEAHASPLLRCLRQAQRSRRAPPVHELLVGEMEPEEARALALALLAPPLSHGLASPAGPGLVERAQDIARRAGYIPFLIREVAACVRDHAASPCPPAARAITLEQVLQVRLSRLSRPARALLDAVALSGRPLPCAVAIQAAGLDTARGQGALLELQAARLVRFCRMRPDGEADAGVDTYHDRVREAVRAHLPRARAARLHRGLAEALVQQGSGEPEELAVHFHDAGDRVAAAVYTVRAAQQAVRSVAFDRAGRLCQQARQLLAEWPGQRPHRRELLAEIGDVLASIGRGPEAAEAFLAALSGGQVDAELQRRAAEQLLSSGYIDKGLDVLRSVLGHLGIWLPETRRGALLSLLLGRIRIALRGTGFVERAPHEMSEPARLRIDSCWSAVIGLHFGDPIRAADLQQRHLRLALEAGEPYRIARALAMEAAYRAAFGRRSQPGATRLLQAAEALARQIGSEHALGLHVLTAGVAAFVQGRWLEARDLLGRAGKRLEEAVRAGRCSAANWEICTARIYQLHAMLQLGEVQLLSRMLPPILQDAEERGNLYEAVYLRTGVSYLVHIAADQPHQARQEAAEALASLSDQRFLIPHWLQLWGETETYLYAGEPGRAWELIRRRWIEVSRSMFLHIKIILIHSLYLRARCSVAMALDSSRRASLLGQAGRDAARIRREGWMWSTALAELIEAGIATLRGDRERALRALLQAEASFTTAGMALHAAAARHRLGELIGGEEGRGWMAGAEAWMVRQGIRRPDRVISMFVPGAFGPSSPGACTPLDPSGRCAGGTGAPGLTPPV